MVQLNSNAISDFSNILSGLLSNPVIISVIIVIVVSVFAFIFINKHTQFNF